MFPYVFVLCLLIILFLIIWYRSEIFNTRFSNLEIRFLTINTSSGPDNIVTNPIDNGMDDRPKLKPIRRRLFSSPSIPPSQHSNDSYDTEVNNYCNQEIRNSDLKSLSIGKLLTLISCIALRDSREGALLQDHIDELYNRLVNKLGLHEVNQPRNRHQSYGNKENTPPPTLIPIPEDDQSIYTTPVITIHQFDTESIDEVDRNLHEALENVKLNPTPEIADRPRPFKDEPTRLDQDESRSFQNDPTCSFQNIDQQSSTTQSSKIFRPTPRRPTTLDIPSTQVVPRAPGLRHRKRHSDSPEQFNEDLELIAGTLLDLSNAFNNPDFSPYLDQAQSRETFV